MRYAAIVVGLMATCGSGMAAGDPLEAWRSGVKIHPVTNQAGRHTIHSYFNSSPESPDGKWVLFYSSTTPEGEAGDVRIVSRITGEEKVVASGLHTEDAHRVACQQWMSNGRRIVFHDFRGNEPVVVTVDLDTMKPRVLARGMLVGFAPANSDVIPIYPPHWKNSSGRRDLELLNIATGEIRPLVTAEAMLKAYPDRIRKVFGDQPITLFFPMLSPDLKRVYFKLSTPKSTNFRSAEASFREMLIVYDIPSSKFLYIRDHWGHPDWNPDSRHILNVPNVIDDVITGVEAKIPGLPTFPGQHLCFSRDGTLFATDTRLTGDLQGPPGYWGVAVADVRGNRYVMLDKFDNSHGAKTWRVSHPHPVFSPDSKRLYFNVSSTPWTQLFVAESGGGTTLTTSRGK